jgi:hypothetical protein
LFFSQNSIAINIWQKFCISNYTIIIILLEIDLFFGFCSSLELVWKTWEVFGEQVGNARATWNLAKSLVGAR